MTRDERLAIENKRRNGASWVRRAGWGFASFLILLPLVAMQFTREVNWNLGDFLVAFLMIASVGLALELAVKASPSNHYRGGAAVALAGAFLTVWVNGAVGIIGSENGDVNLIFFFVLLVALFGSIAARFRPRPMVLAMVATAVAQGAVILVAPFTGLSSDAPIWSAEVLLVTFFFAGIWLTAASLFAMAARTDGD